MLSHLVSPTSPTIAGHRKKYVRSWARPATQTDRPGETRERERERGAIKQGQGQRVRARDRVRSGVGFGHLDDQVVLVRPGQSVGVQGVVRGGQFWYD